MAEAEDVGNPSDDNQPDRRQKSVSAAPKQFIEIPFAAALFEDEASYWCGSCFRRPRPPSPALLDCENGCWRMKYCNHDCSRDDRHLHQYECQSYRQRMPSNIDRSVHMLVRLVGRLVVRYSKDNGEQVLPIGVPLKDRTLNDLITRSNGQNMDQQFVERVMESFRQFFVGTWLSVMAEENLRQFVRCAVAGSIDVVNCTSPHDVSYLGSAVYVVSSLFGHSCHPTGSYRFDGNRINIKIVSPNIDIQKVDQFNAITLCFHCGPDLEYSCYVGTSVPIDNDVQCRPIGCRCPECLDDTMVKRQLDSSLLECKCGQPYVWLNVDGQRYLEASCQCEETRAPSNAEYVRNNIPKVIELIEKFTPVVVEGFLTLRSIYNATTIRDRIQACAHLFDLAMTVWHPKKNLRLGRLCEITFRLYDVLRGHEELSANDLIEMIRYGEIAIEIYQTYLEPHILSVATMAVKLARVLSERKRRKDRKRVRELCEKAAEIFMSHQHENFADAVRDELGKMLSQWCNFL